MASRSVLLALSCVAAARAQQYINTDDDVFVTNFAKDQTHLAVYQTGDVVMPAGTLSVSTVHYPVINGLRTKESSVAADEAVYSTVTKSSLTATRASTLYTQAQMKAGFGTDVSFQTQDKTGYTNEMGTIGFAMNGDGTGAADFVIKSW